METKQIFQINPVSLIIDQIGSTIKIQLQKNKQIEGEHSFTLDQLKKESIYFYLFSSIEEAFKSLVSLAQDNKILIKERSDHYQLKVLINQKELSKIKLSIPKKLIIPSKLLDQESMKLIKTLFDNQTAMIQQLSTRLESIEGTLFKMNNMSLSQLAQQSEAIDLSDDMITGKTVGFLNEEEKEMLCGWLNNTPIGWKLLYYPTKGRDNYTVCDELCYGFLQS